MDIKALIAAKKAAQPTAEEPKQEPAVEPKTTAEIADDLYDTLGYQKALQRANDHMISHTPGSTAFLHWQEVCQELHAIKESSLPQVSPSVASKPTITDADRIQAMEEKSSGFGHAPASVPMPKYTEEQAEAKAQEMIAKLGWQKAVDQALHNRKKLAGISSLNQYWTWICEDIKKLEPQPAQPAQPAQAEPSQMVESKAKRSLAEIIAAKKAQSQAQALAQEPSALLPSALQDQPTATAIPAVEQSTGTASAAPGYEAAKAEYHGAFSLDITLNEKQLLAKDYAMAGKNFCLIGPAGSGKTTTQREVAATLLEQGRLHQTSFKLQGMNGQRVSAPSIAFVAYTRRAAANLQRAVHKLPELEEALRYNIMTVHALLEYEPFFFYDEEKQKESMRFEPQRHAGNPLDITHLVIEESSMLGLDLWDRLYDALPPGVQIIFIGDINQLPPVFGPSILNYALVQLPVVELDRVYRQAGDSNILGNAHKILAGESDLIEAPDFVIMEGKNPVQVGQSKMAITLAKIFEMWCENGEYDPEQDMILSPYNKQDLGTTNMNKFIAQFLGQKRNAVVYEIIAGFNKHYLAVGDRVMVNKQDGVIEEIVHNGNYMGQMPQPASEALTRFGILLIDHAANGEGSSLDDEVNTLSYENFSLATLEEQDVERKQQASHVVKVRILDTGALVELTGAGDFSEQVFSLGYVLTVHKAQGCEWRKVFFIFHKDHATMHYRELVYTAVTRAREQFMWIAKRCYIKKAIENPRIKGNNLADKIEYFNANLDMAMQVRCVR